MAIKYLAGERMIGTAAERAAMTSYDVGVWKQIGRASAENNSTVNIPCVLDPICPYLMVLCNHTPYEQTNTDPAIRFTPSGGSLNTDSDYVCKKSQNGNAYSSNATTSFVLQGGTSQCPEFDVGFIANPEGQEKTVVFHSFDSSGDNSSASGKTFEIYGKWNETTQIGTVHLHNVQGGTPLFESGSEIVVLGFDPDDTTGAVSKWEDLTGNNGIVTGSATNTLSTGTFAAKKYMLMEAHVINEDPDGSPNNLVPHMVFNGEETGEHYTRRRSGDGGSLSNNTGQNEIDCSEGNDSANQYYTYWISNVADQVKMVIGHTTGDSAGTGSAPSRKEIWGKWNRTSGSGTGDASSQITKIELKNNDGNTSNAFAVGSRIRVWGFD